MTIPGVAASNSAVPRPGGSTRAAWRVVAAVLLLASAAFQIQASLQRWVGAWHAAEGRAVAIDDEAFDYALPFALLGINAVVAGLTAEPFVLHPLALPLYLINLAGFAGIAVLWRRGAHTTVADMVAGACLLGSSMPGIVVSTLVVAPLIHGQISHDTSRWTETVVGATTALAGIMALIAAGVTGSASAPERGNGHRPVGR